ncbi:MAG: 6,7-dimethyl-8-ribityllumazine synthase [Acidimicrobiia bacterium]
MGSYTDIEGGFDVVGMRFAVVCGRFNDFVTNALLDGARAGFARHGVEPTQVREYWVPGAFEMPLVAKTLGANGDVDAVVCLGAVIRGDTPHFDYVAGQCADGLTRAALDTGVPVVFGVLTVDTVEQAEVRSRPDTSNKGFEAAATAIEMVDLLRRLGSYASEAGR